MKSFLVTFKRSRVLIIGSILLAMLGVLVMPRAMVRARAPEQTCLAVESGNGSVGGLDAQVDFSTDNGATFQDAFVVAPLTGTGCCDYSTIGTSKWVSVAVNKVGASNSFFIYRITFELPCRFADPSLTVQVLADNNAAVSLNGNSIGAQTDDPGEPVASFQMPSTFGPITNAGFFQAGTNTLSFLVHNYTAQTALDFHADICFTDQSPCEQPTCRTCDEGVVVVDQNVTVNLNPAMPTCSGDPDLCPFFTFDKSGPTPSTWKAIFDVGAKKLLVKNGATITVVPGPPNGGNNKEAPGIEIRSTCDFEIEPGGAVVVQSINRQAGDIVIRVNGDITINGTVSDSVTGTNGRPGDITIASCCGNILTGPKSLIQTIGVDHGGSDINILACDSGNITINGLVDASYKAALASTINIAAFGGAVTINGNNFQGIEAGTQRRITSGVTVRSNRDPLAGKIFIQALNDITVLGNSILHKNYPNYGAVAVKPTSTNGTSGDGSIMATSVAGRIVASDRAFDIANRFNKLNDITLLAKGDIDLSVTALVDNGAGTDITKAVVNSQGGDTGKGGINNLRSFSGAILIGQKAQVLADFTGRPGSNGENFLVSCVGITNLGTVAPADAVPGNDSGMCGQAAPIPFFLGCAEFGVGCIRRPPIQ